jgi:cell division protein FtsW (lipid II flippase)
LLTNLQKYLYEFKTYRLTVWLAENVVVMIIIITNDSQKAQSSLYAFIEIVYMLIAFLLVIAGGAIVGEKLWLRGKAEQSILPH